MGMRWGLGMSARQRKIWLSVVATIVGTLALTYLGVWVQAARNTDFNDRTAGISADDLVVAVNAAPIRFREVAAACGLASSRAIVARRRFLPEDTGSGLAWGDCDGDGDFDLYVVAFSSEDAPSAASHSCLYRNDGGQFLDITAAAGVANPQACGMGASWADYDDDGDADLLVTNYGAPNRLYRNRGNGVFDDVAAEAGVAESQWSTGAAWGDYDRDGNLDLYICNYVDYDARLAKVEVAASRGGGPYSVPFALNPNSFDPAPNRLYRNRGDGTFEDVTERCGVADAEGRSFSAAFVDMDGDSWLDLFVANDVSPNVLYHNMLGVKEGSFYRTLSDPSESGERSPAAFVEVSAITGVADSRGSMGLSVAETGAMNGQYDALPDLFITHWVAQENALYQSLRLDEEVVEYRDKIREFRLGEISLNVVGWGCGFCDLDLDSRADLLVANGSTLEDRDDTSRLIAEPVFVFWNDGQQFQEIASRTCDALSRPYVARGLAIADFNDDGWPDVAVSINRGEPLLLLNQTSLPHQFLKVRLQAPAAACFGAKVEVVVAGQPQVQWWGADVSLLSQHASELIFGLGRGKQADAVRVTWADGKVNEYPATLAGRFVAKRTD